MNSTGKKIKELRQELNMTQEELGNKLGIQKAAIQKYESGVVENLKRNVIIQLAEILNTTPNNLMGWDDSDATLNLMESAELYNISSKSVIKSIKIPVLGKVAAGIAIEAIENYDSDEWEEIPQAMASKADYFALKIQGESMEPKFSDGDVVIVKKQDDVESGDIGVVIVNGSDATVKKIMKQDNGILLIASNQIAYSPMFYDNESIENLPVVILGKVVELRAKF